jgi:UDP-N-acetylmuramoyl-L-alanyl-D-glutamate--2,6-diaminopimelate ligase
MAAATPEGQAFEVVVDRTEAIFRAVQAACDSNRDVVVCLLAKGDETRQHVGDEFPYMEPDGSVFSRALRECEEAARQREDVGEDHGA